MTKSAMFFYHNLIKKEWDTLTLPRVPLLVYKKPHQRM